MSAPSYVIAGTDLRGKVMWLLNQCEANRHAPNSLMTEADDPRHPEERTSLARTYVLHFVSPLVWGEQGDSEMLLLYAVLTLNEHCDPAQWTGWHDFVDRSFEHMRAIGETEAARQLRQRVTDAAGRQPDPLIARLRRDSLGNDPGRLAEHAQVMAQGSRRNLRAADALGAS